MAMAELLVGRKTELVVMQNTKVRPSRSPYEERLAIFAGGRLFHEVEAGVTHDANGLRCQACGSAAPKRLRNMEDINGNRYLVGQECYLQLRKAFDEWPEVKRLGRAFELWIKENEAALKNRHTWQLVELYIEREAKDAKLYQGFV